MFEAFFPLIALFVIMSLVSTVTKAAKKASAGLKKPGPAAPRNQAGAPASARQGATPATAWNTAANPAAQDSSSAAAQSAPRVLQPSVTVTEHDDSVYLGSLGVVTGEGIDPCHDEQLAGLNQAEKSEPVQTAEPAFRLSWTGDDIVRGFVIGEILKRKGA